MTALRDQIFELLAGGPPLGLQPAEIALALGLGRGRAPHVRHLLQNLVRQGVVVREGRHYRLQPSAIAPDDGAPTAGDTETEAGTLVITSYGRALIDRGEAYDPLRVAPGDTGAAIDGDRVEAEVWEHRGRQRGRVVRVVERGRARLTGVMRGPPWRLEPDDPRLPEKVTIVEPDGAAAGEVVLANIVEYPAGPGEPLRATVARRLGEPGDLLTEIAKVLATQDVQEWFAEPVLEGLDHLPDHVRDEDLVDRVDMRQRQFVTIDPLTARDFDDAVAVERGPGGCDRVWIAVADVTHYVPEGSLIDREARRRGCSIYLPDRAVPMLPEPLSSGICSLMPYQDRLALVVRLDVASEGQVIDSDCRAAVIHSRGRLDYGGVAAALEGDFRGRREAYREHADQLIGLQRVARGLRAQRLHRGSLDLDLPEARVVLDEDDPRRVRDVVASRGSAPIKRAYALIEELMLAANEAVARYFIRHDCPTLWRIHPVPDDDALRQLANWLASYGITIPSRGLRTPRGMARLVRELRGHPAEQPLSYLVLRTLKQASYHVDNCGHFGLASEAYLHFTSPIRRYPDLHVHRLLKAVLRDAGLPAGRRCALTQQRVEDLSPMARETSLAERRALDIERQVHSTYAASLMRDRIGDEHSGTVTGLTRFGVFINIQEPYVDGLVRFDSLDEWMEFDAERLRLYGSSSGRVVSLGDTVRVRVADASVGRRQIDLKLLEWGEPLAGPAPRRQPSERPRGKRQASPSTRRPSRPQSRRR